MTSMRDLIIIGGGPAGLSAALNAAAEGLSVTLLERADTLGGQAGTSSRIENYLGFPTGVNGKRLTEKSQAQAERLGATLYTGTGVERLRHNAATDMWLTETANDKFISTAVLLAVGVDYRRLDIPGGMGDNVFYGAPADSHADCTGLSVVVIGGGNSAGQAALNLVANGAHVTLLVRRPLSQTMSRYLIERIAVEAGIDARIGNTVEVRDGELDYIAGDPDAIQTVKADRVYAYIGSTPRTDFVNDCCKLDTHGFVHTDAHLMAATNGLFVAGDVRAGSSKRVAVAAGEGAIASAGIWQYINKAGA